MEASGRAETVDSRRDCQDRHPLRREYKTEWFSKKGDRGVFRERKEIERRVSERGRTEEGRGKS